MEEQNRAQEIALSPQDFAICGEEAGGADLLARKPVTYWQDAWRRFFANKLAVCALVLLCVIALATIFAPLLSGQSPTARNLLERKQWPSARHLFGTDELGRDLFVRVWTGGRVSIAIGIGGAAIVAVVGCLYGGLAAYFGGKVDMLMMRFVDVFSAVPSLLYSILLIMFMGPKMSSILIAICLTYWLSPARQTRGQILSVKNQDFATAAKVVGESKVQILLRHLVPNSMGPIIVTVMLLIPSAIFEEAFLSFIGIGIAVPVASWGTLANDGMATMGMYPYLMLFPALAISLTMFALNFIGDGLRDALDPRLKK